MMKYCGVGDLGGKMAPYRQEKVLLTEKTETEEKPGRE